MKSIKQGDIFVCKKKVEMFGDNEKTYTKGVIYRSEQNGCITDNSGNFDHQWNGSPLKEHFIKIKNGKNVLIF